MWWLVLEGGSYFHYYHKIMVKVWHIILHKSKHKSMIFIYFKGKLIYSETFGKIFIKIWTKTLNDNIDNKRREISLVCGTLRTRLCPLPRHRMGKVNYFSLLFGYSYLFSYFDDENKWRVFELRLFEWACRLQLCACVLFCFFLCL